MSTLRHRGGAESSEEPKIVELNDDGTTKDKSKSTKTDIEIEDSQQLLKKWWNAAALGNLPSPWTKENIADLAFWSNMVMSALIGLGCGLTQVEGARGFMMYAAIQLLFTRYHKSRLSISEEEMPMMTFLSEGGMGAVSLFILMWTLTYNSLWV